MNVAAGPELAAAVTNAGGLGVIGGVGYTPEFLRERFTLSSDGVLLSFCLTCGAPAIKEGVHECSDRRCPGGEFAERVENHGFHVLLAELRALGVNYTRPLRK